MKKCLLLLFLSLSLTLAPSCAADTENSQSSGSETPHSAPDTAVIDDGTAWFLTCRIVDGAETGLLVLAENGEAGTGVYTLSLSSLPESFIPGEPLRNGQLINVYYDSFTEAWPMGFGGVSSIDVVDGGFDDRCALYLRVLEDLWEVDPALSEGVEVIGMDLSQTSLTPAEQAAVGWIFAGSHGAELVDGSVEELIDQGYITASPLEVSAAEEAPNEPKHYFYHWENGCHFSITEQPMEGTYSLVPVTFDAMKWRSSLGAYIFCDCTAVQSALGEWGDYQIGAEAIS